MIPKLAKGVRMDGERIIKLSGQGSVYIRCIDPLEDEDKDEEDEQLTSPTFSQLSDDLSNNPVVTMSSPLQQPISQPQPLDQADPLFSVPVELPVEVPPFIDLWSDQSTHNNCDVVISNFVPTSPTCSDEVPTKIIRVHRSLIREDMIEVFLDPSILKFNLNAIIINQHGIEEAGQGNGVLREVFPLFWKDCYESHMLGECERVPYIRHDFDRKKWEAVGTILVKGYTDCQYFPLKISKAFFTGCLFGEGSVMMLQDSFKHYVSKSEASVIEGCLSDSIQGDNVELLDFLSAFDCKRRVTQDNLEETIRELAHKEIIQKPQYVADCWGPIVSHLKLYFPDMFSLHELYSSILPTNVKVISLLKAKPLTAAEGETLAHLKRFIRGLDESKLATFLRFTTASDVLVTDTLTISFTNNEGFQRRPVAHTCSYTLELPSTYSSFCEFREEFMAVLNADNWEMTIV